MNPFLFGKIADHEHFCPRDELLAELTDAIESGQNLVIYGHRRVGKSSLVLHAAEQHPEKFFFLVDLFFTKDTAMFLEYCTSSLFAFNTQRQGMLEKGMQALKRIRPKMELDPQTGVPSITLSISQEPPEVLLNTVDDFYAFLADEFEPDQLIVCFDEFQSVLNYPDADILLAKIRSKVQYHKFPYIFTGSDRTGLKRIFSEAQSPFYKSVRPIEVKEIPREAFQPFLQAKFKKGKRKVTAEVWDSIFELEITGDIQHLCSALWQSSAAGTTLDQQTLELAYDRIFSQEIEGFRLSLSRLSALQFRVLKAIAQSGTDGIYSLESQQSIHASSSSIRRSITGLIDKWILVKDDDEIYFNNPFLKRFINERKI